MVSMLSQSCLYVIALGVMLNTCDGFTMPLPTHRSPHLTAVDRRCERKFEWQRSGGMLLQLSSNSEDKKDFWEKQKELAQEMSDAADKSLKEYVLLGVGVSLSSCCPLTFLHIPSENRWRCMQSEEMP